MVQAMFNAQTGAIYQAADGLTMENAIELLQKGEPFPGRYLKRL